MDNKGRVTVILHWDQRQGNSGGIAGSSSATGSTIIHSSSGVSSTCNGPLLDKFSPSKKGGGGGGISQSSIDKSTMQQRYPSPQITVINHDDIQSAYGSGRRYVFHFIQIRRNFNYTPAGVAVFMFACTNGVSFRFSLCLSLLRPDYQSRAADHLIRFTFIHLNVHTMCIHLVALAVQVQLNVTFIVVRYTKKVAK